MSAAHRLGITSSLEAAFGNDRKGVYKKAVLYNQAGCPIASFDLD